MRTEKMRKQLQAYIGAAEKGKVKAMYTLFQELIEESEEAAFIESLGTPPVSRREDWWNDEVFVAEMDAEYEAAERGEVKTYSLEEAKAFLAEKKRERANGVRA